jgi:hypothetical protein
MKNMRRLLWLLVLLIAAGMNRLMAQIASFSFAGPSTVPGWTNVSGDPALAVQTAPAGGIILSSVSTANWSPNGDGNSAFDYGGASGGGYFPSAVMANSWIQYNGTGYNLALYNAAVPQIELTGLNPDSTYILRMTGSTTYNYPSTTQYTVAGLTVSGSQQLNPYNNTTQGVTFQGVRPDASGMIRVYVNPAAGNTFAWICGLQIFPGSANVGTPVVAMTAPTNGTVQSEGGNFILTATASETGGTIAKVEFYADTTKIGEADAAPYTMTWVDPDPGSYQLTAKATDNVGTISTASVNVGVQSLNYFWSTTGNIATSGDSNFVGTVDSNRLTFRTKNIDRMTISAIGNVGIGTDSPTAQLHTTGSVRFAGLASDSMLSRIVVSDSTGKLYYQNIGSSGLLSPGPGLGGTSTGLALGDSIAGPGPHSFTSNRYQYLNGYQYSIGGSVNDPVNRPVFRVYNNGDITASTTMDRSVNTAAQTGLRFYSKLGILQIGATDRLDTTVNVSEIGGGIVMNSEDSANASLLKARLFDSYIAGNAFDLDSTASVGNSIVNGGEVTMKNGSYTNSQVSGFGLNFGASIDNSIITGNGHSITKQVSVDNISGFLNNTMDTSRGSLVAGASNQFGGLWQTVSGVDLANRTPGGATFGSGNVDFASLPYTGTKGFSTPGLAGYPLFVLGNSSSSVGTRSNALTVLYNGRTQINTTGFVNSITQAQVTPAAALDVVSTNTGVLLPRLTTAQRNAIVSGDLHNGLLLYNTDSSAFQYYNGTAWNSVGSGSSGSSGRWLFANGTVYDTLDNIAIGTSNPQGYKLAVNGSGIFTKIVAKPQANWPDYVFDKSYRLPSLIEVEQFIQAHHHLPGVTPQAEILRNGIDLGEGQTTLLKKVEELTLYLINENESLTTQNRKMTEQSKMLTEQARQLADQTKQFADQTRQLNEQNARLEAQQKEIEELKALIRADHKQ